MAGRLSQFLSALRMGLVSDVPPEFQACESCREPTCDSIKAAGCQDRRFGEEQERSRREGAGRSGTHVIGAADSSGFDVPLSRMAAGNPPKSEVRSRSAGEYSQSGGVELETFSVRGRSKTG